MSEPTQDEIGRLPGPTLLEFGTSWCGHCRRALPIIAHALAAHPKVKHVKIEDGSGRRLGRAYGVKLWPTLVFLSDGKEKTRLVRPPDSETVLRALEQIDAG